MWNICILISIMFLLISILSVIYNVKKNDRKKVNNPITILAVGFFASAFVLFLPICSVQYKDYTGRLLLTILASLHNCIRMFLVDIDFGVVTEAGSEMTSGVRNAYVILGAIVITVSPLLTVGVFLSFFKNAMSYQRYILHYRSDVYVFSEINEKTLALAESIRETDKKCLLVFTDVFESEEERSYELRERANLLNALCFKKDIIKIKFQFHSEKSQMYFMLMGEDENENVEQALTLINNYKQFSKARIYLLAKTEEAELILKATDQGKIQMVRRFKEAESLIFRILYDTGNKIFEHTRLRDGKKLISAIIVGMGEYGMEMAKAMPWFCQMPEYCFEMHIVDRDEKTQSKLEMMCPDLLSSKYNGVAIEGEPNYKITVHSGIDVNTIEFKKLLEKIENPTYVFVALGNDGQNIKTSIDVRSFYADHVFEPRIQAILFKGAEKERLYEVKCNQRATTKPYQIEFVGDLKTTYSKESVLYSEVEKKALKRHWDWGATMNEFWTYDYSYRSSIASVIHHKMKILCKIPYAEVEPEKRPNQEREALRKLEHCRWSAYVRSEGYTFGKTRNDLAKKHPCLVPYDELSPVEKAKDDV